MQAIFYIFFLQYYLHSFCNLNVRLSTNLGFHDFICLDLIFVILLALQIIVLVSLIYFNNLENFIKVLILWGFLAQEQKFTLFQIIGLIQVCFRKKNAHFLSLKLHF